MNGAGEVFTVNGKLHGCWDWGRHSRVDSRTAINPLVVGTICCDP